MANPVRPPVKPATRPSKAAELREFVKDPETQGWTLLTIGTLIWRLVNHLSNVEFLLSFTNGGVSTVLTFLNEWGWLIVAAGGAFFLYRHWRDRKNPTALGSPNWLTVFVIGCLAFLFGISAAIGFGSYPPSVIIAWGGIPDACNVVVDGAQLGGFADKYKVAFACGIFNPTEDKMRDQNITLSNVFDIIPQQIPIVVEHSSKMQYYLNLIAKVHPGANTQTWNLALLVPSNIVLSHMGTLQEFRTNGGKILGYDR